MRHARIACIALLLAACTSEEDLPCDGPSFMLDVPESRAGDVADVQVSGAFCSPNGVECISESDAGCLTWWITPNEGARGEGSCVVEVSFDCDLPEERVDITWSRHDEGACDGSLYADPNGHTLAGPTCDDFEASGGAGGVGTAGAAGVEAGAGQGGAAHAGGGG